MLFQRGRMDGISTQGRIEQCVCFSSTFVCPTEIIAFSERLKEFQKIKCNVVACSCDSHYCHLAW